MRLRTVGVAALAAGALSACGGGDSGGGDDGAREFRDRSQKLCGDIVASGQREARRFEQAVDDVAQTGDPEALRQEMLRFLRGLDGAIRPFFERSQGVVPPEGAEAWRRLTEQSLAAYDRILARQRTAIEDAQFDDPQDIERLQQRLAEVGAGFEDITRRADATYRRYGADGCVSTTIARALG
jgi:hypothetical protein